MSPAEISAIDYEVNIAISCPTGKLDSIQKFGQVPSTQSIRCGEETEYEDENGILQKEMNYFNYFPETCASEGGLNDQESWGQFQDNFKLFCKGEESCDYKFKESWLPKQCRVEGTLASEWQYVMTAVCKSTDISVGSEDNTISKTTVAIYITIFDLFLSFFFWFALLTLHPMVRLIDEEVND